MPAGSGELLGAENPELGHTLDMEGMRTQWEELAGPDRQLLLLRFYGNMTQTQIAERMGVSQMQVSRLLRRVLDYLRDRITGDSGLAFQPVRGGGRAGIWGRSG